MLMRLYQRPGRLQRMPHASLVRDFRLDTERGRVRSHARCERAASCRSAALCADAR